MINKEHDDKIAELNNQKKTLKVNIMMDVNKKIEKKIERRDKQEEEKQKQMHVSQMVYDSYVLCHIPKLEEWSGKTYDKIIYDSNTDGEDSSVFESKVMDQQYLYFIVVDSDNNVFGNYCSAVLDVKDNYIPDEESFIFTLNSNNRCVAKKYDVKKLKNKKTMHIHSGRFYGCGVGHVISVAGINNPESYVKCGSGSCYEGSSNLEIVGTDSNDETYFTPKRVVVIQMK